MAITISGSGITSANILDGTIVNADINSSAAIAGTKVSGSFGKIANVWKDEILGGETVSVTNTAFTASGLDITVTPSSSDSKFIIFCDIKFAASFNVGYRLYDDTRSAIVEASTTSGSRVSLNSGGSGGSGMPHSGNDNGVASQTSIIYYSPASSQASTRFQIWMTGLNGSGTVYHGRNVSNTTARYDSYGVSSITILEVTV